MVNVEALLRSSLDDRYDIEGEIGRGGMSVVYRAHDLKHNRTVAIKVLRPELSEQIGTERFQREINVVAGLIHPHILPLHDSGQIDGLLYYVMPFVEGGSLRARIERDGALPEADALRITREIADALGCAHEHDVVHRDVKPGNILLSGDHALLADFGVAHLAGGVAETLTAAGLALGTPAYLSPEQASGETQIDGRADIYSLGCVLYEALTGSAPFSGDSVRAMIIHQIVDTPPSVRSLRGEVSPAAETIVETAIRKSPDERFQTGQQMVQALEALGADSQELPGLYSWSVGALQSLSVRARLAILAAALIVAVALILLPPDGPGTGPVRYLVVEYVGDNASATERAVATKAAQTLRRQLRSWKRSVSVVSAVAMEGSTADLRVAGVAQGSRLFGANLADDLDVDFLVVVEADDLSMPDGVEADPDPGRVEIRIRPFDSGGAAGTGSDPAYTEVEIHAVRRDQRRGGEDLDYMATGRADSLHVLTADIALQLLELDGDPRDYPTLLGRSLDHVAQQEFEAGKDALRDWRLAEARRHFEAAISRDSTFALAHHLLAETMYWQTEQSAELMEELGPRIESHSRQADWRRSEENLRPLEREAVDAFRAFWTGEYDLARDRYDSLIFADSTDLEALVLRGAVEFEDMMLREESDGTLLPRRNLNVARNVFRIADMLNPRWHLAWGHLHSITRQIAESVWLGKCPGFELPGEEMVAPWVVREAAEQRYFCPVFVADTIAWTPYQPDELPGDSASWAAAARLHAETLEALERNTARELGHARHHEELAGFVLTELGLFPCESRPARNDSLRLLARRHLVQALEARQDTTPQELITLAAIDLGGGYVAPAMAMTARAFDQLGDWRSLEGTPPPTEAANAFLAAGRIEVVLDILHRAYARRTTSILDPLNDGRFIDTFGTMGTLLELQAMGVLGETGPPVDERVDLVLRTWADAPLPDTDRMLLRVGTLEFVGPALAHSEALWQRWFDGWSELEWEVPPVWKGLIAAAESPLDRAEARSQLYGAVAALGAYPDDDPVEAIDLYLPVLLAERIGATDVEMELRRRMSQCELNYGQFDAGWGAVRSLGLLE